MITIDARGFFAIGALILSASGCASITTSSGDHLRPDESSATATCGLAEADESVTNLFKSRGIPIVSETEPSATARLLKFKGPRGSVTSVSGNAQWVSGSTDAIGSVYYVRLSAEGGTGTKAVLLGKPTADGKEVCSPQDWKEIKCDGVTTGAAWPGRAQMTGREESEVITGVLLEYRKTCRAKPAPAPTAPAPAAAP